MAWTTVCSTLQRIKTIPVSSFGIEVGRLLRLTSPARPPRSVLQPGGAHQDRRRNLARATRARALGLAPSVEERLPPATSASEMPSGRRATRHAVAPGQAAGRGAGWLAPHAVPPRHPPRPRSASHPSPSAGPGRTPIPAHCAGPPAALPLLGSDWHGLEQRIGALDKGAQADRRRLVPEADGWPDLELLWAALTSTAHHPVLPPGRPARRRRVSVWIGPRPGRPARSHTDGCPSATTSRLRTGRGGQALVGLVTRADAGPVPITGPPFVEDRPLDERPKIRAERSTYRPGSAELGLGRSEQPESILLVRAWCAHGAGCQAPRSGGAGQDSAQVRLVGGLRWSRPPDSVYA